MMHNIFHSLELARLKVRLRNLIERNSESEYSLLAVPLEELTVSEEDKISKYWDRLKPSVKGSGLPAGKKYLTGFKLFKTLEHFDPRWIVGPIMYPRMILALEDPVFESALVHKAGYSMYLSQIRQPNNLIKCINGQYFDERMKPINQDDAIGTIKREGEAIIKSTYGSSQGKSVSKVTSNDDICKIFASYKGNFVCQELIKQSSDLAKYHPSSVNSLRVVSLFINGRLSICVIILRIGQADSIVDNAGAGGIMIACDTEGNLREYGYDHFGNRHYDNGEGLRFKGQRIENMDKVLEAVYRYHPYYFPTMGLVAWDWSIGEDGEPILIEVNLGGLQFYPDITTTQLAKGAPFFGDRTDEVITFVNDHQERIWKGLKV